MAESPSAGVPTGGEDDDIARLLKRAGPRPAVPAERAARVRAQVRERWQQRVRARKRSRWILGGLATAAAVTLAVSLVQRRQTPAVTATRSERVGHLEVATGDAPELLDPGAGRWTRLAIGGPVLGGSTVSTPADGRAALRLADEVSLRMDSETRIHLVSAGELLLERGAVYVDTQARQRRGAGVEVRTPFGTARDVGTQFEVRVARSALRVRVREGTVVLSRGSGAETAEAGAELAVNGDGALIRRPVPVHGAEWDWVISVAPVFEIEGSHLDALLTWVSRETGLQLHFQDEDIVRAAARIGLHGTIEGLTPVEALDAVLPTCGLTYHIDEGTLRVGRTDPGS